MAFNVQKITTTNKTELDFNNHKSMIFTNNHATDAVTIDLYVTSQVGTDITATLVYSAETVAATTVSDTVTIDNGSGSASVADTDAFLNERVYKADGTFIGICTAVTTTLLTFSGGLENAVTDNDILQTGTRYHVLKAVSVPVGQTLILDGNEVNFNSIDYSLYITLGAGSIDLIARQ